MLVKTFNSALQNVSDVTRDASGGTLSQKEAATLIGCNDRAIPTLIESGMLSGSAVKKRFQITPESAKAFAARYVALRLIASERHTSVARLIRLSGKFDIELLKVQCAPHSLVWFVARESSDRLSTICRENPANPESEVSEDAKSRLQMLAEYFDTLRARDSPLPRRAGLAIRRAIALAAGVDRSVFYTDEEAMKLFDAYDQEDRRRHRIAKRDDIASLKKYVEKMRQRGKNLPRRGGGKLNKFAIATACGIDRNIFYKSEEALIVLKAAVDL